MFEAILRNRATQDNLYWREITETDTNWILHNYHTEKYGVVSNTKTLPKFLWELVSDKSSEKEVEKPNNTFAEIAK